LKGVECRRLQQRKENLSGVTGEFHIKTVVAGELPGVG